MADVNLTQVESLDLAGLGYFKEKQDAFNDQKIATAKGEAIEHANELAEGLEIKGTAQTKMEELANGAVKDNTDAIAKLNGDAETEGSVAKAVADGVKAETDARVEAVAGVQGAVDTLAQTVADNKTAVEARVKAIEDDYLVEADKTELQGNIDTLAGKVGEVAEGKTLAGLVAENAQAISTLNGEGEGSVKKTVDDAINKFATDVTDDAVVNSYKELIDWVAEHGSEAAEMAEAIQTNKTDIAELEALVGTLPEGATVTTIVELIQSLVNAEKSRAEGIEGGLDTRLKAVEEAIGEDGAVSEQIASAIAELDADVNSGDVETGMGVKIQVTQLDGEVNSVVVTGNYDAKYDAIGAANTAKTEAISAAAEDATTKANKAEENAKAEVTALAEGAVADNTQAIADNATEIEAIKTAMPTALTPAQIDTLFAEATA